MFSAVFRFFSSMDTHWFVVATAWISRLVVIGSRFLLIFYLLQYLGVEEYAIFAVITSLEGWFLLCDGGLGSSAQNFLSESRAKGVSSLSLQCSIMQTGLLFLAISVLIFMGVTPLLASFLFKGGNYSIGHVYALGLTGVFYAFFAVGSVAYRALYAFQKGYWVHVLQALVAVLILIFVWVLTRCHFSEGQLLTCLSCVAGIPACFSFGAFLKIFPARQLFSQWNFIEIKALCQRSFSFLGFGIGAMAVLGIDYMIMVRYLASEDIVLYNITSKMFQGFFFMHGVLMQAVWPVCSELVTVKKYQDLKNLLRRYCFYGLFFIGAVTLVIACFSPYVFSLLFPDEKIIVPLTTIFLFGLYYVVRVFCDPYAMVLQSMSRMQIFLLAVPSQALISYIAQVYFVQKWGINGIVLGLICSYLCTVSWILPQVFYRALRGRASDQLLS